jgi:biotin transport system substrate-specific component
MMQQHRALSTVNATPTFIGAIWPQQAAKGFRIGALALAGSLALAASAKLQVPFYPVPMTMQSLVVLLIGVAFGWRLGVATVLVYLVEGLLGLPVFAGTPEKGIGLAYMAGPTGGYLLGFVLAAALTGWLAERGWDRSLWRTALALSLGHAALFLTGLAWLAVFVGWSRAVEFGLTPFLAGSLVKTALGVALVRAGWAMLDRRA